MVVDMGLELSQRVAAIAPSVTLAIDAKAKKLRAEGKNVIGFGAGEPDFPTPEYICAAAKDAIDQGMTRYTPVPGTLALREEICKKLLRDNALSYKPENIVVSNGAKQSLFNALSAILNPGDEVLIPSPCWVSYPEMVRMAWGEPVYVKTREEEEFLPTAAALEAAITPKTKALILNSPNNPNGCVYPEKLLRDIADLAVKHGFYVISDEIYEKLIYDGQKHVSIASLGEAIREQTIVVNGVSKSYAMTGWRIGYAAAPAKIAKAMSSFQSHSTSNANSIAQHAAAVAMTNGEAIIADMVKEFAARRDLLVRLIAETPLLKANTPEGAFYVMLNISGVLGKRYQGAEITGSDSFAEMLINAKQVAVVPGKAFGADDHVRMSYAISRENIAEGMRRIAEFVSELE